jgi:hypothetical protein
MEKLKCILNIFSTSEHISQVVTGFLMLQKKGIIDLKIKYISSITNNYPFPQLVEVIIDDIVIAYDMADGCWEKTTVEPYLEKVDFYFKRSFNPEYHHDYLNASRIYPLGFNYHVTTNNNPLDKINIILKLNHCMNNYKKMANIFTKYIYNYNFYFHVDKFEDTPRYSLHPSILFLTKIWSPYGESGESFVSIEDKIEREYINKMRVECVRRLRKEFGNRFIGGLIPSKYTCKNFSEYVVNPVITNRINFLRLIKNSDICIATMGLYKSNGWKLAEYIAASKAIVTEKLHYAVPGNFSIGVNYLQFNNADECIEQTYKLVNNNDFAFEMKVNNYNYYNSYLRPDSLILNSLIIALKNRWNEKMIKEVKEKLRL